ncbi:hypothetical protein PINS_up008126 [Pythium insidiosum]|nr:hypothetical protein PINS_up008125 [Pythium insidiosum]GLD99407.1 hypothetical protein PINS_up008126 [Pythium insidiosum]
MASHLKPTIVDSAETTKITKRQPPNGLHALVIGGGVTGLTTAWELNDRGYRVTVVAERYASKHNRITSQIAGALWEWPPAVCGKHTDEISLDKSKRWCMMTFHRFARMAADPEVSKATGIRMRIANFFFGQPIETCAQQTKKMHEIAANVPGFRHDAAIINELGISPGYGVVDCYQHLSPICDTDQYMQYLYDMLSKREGVTLTHGRVSGDLLQQEAELLKQYNADVIINASGLAARELASDDTVYPLRGALVRVINDGSRFPRITQAMSVSLDGREGAQDMVFIVPRNDNTLILGGLVEPRETNLNLTLDNYAPLRQMYERNLAFYPDLRKAVIDPEYPFAVGLRPFRQKNVRVEREDRVAASRIIHSYGQGGSGFTLSFGCAHDVGEIADQIAREIRPQHHHHDWSAAQHSNKYAGHGRISRL